MTDATMLHLAEPASPTETIALACELANHARAAQDPLAMIEAARTLRGVPRDLLTAGMATPATLFGEARILGEGDAAMLAEIDWVQNGTRRPHHGGARIAPTAVLPLLRNAPVAWGVTFVGRAA